MSTTAQPVGIDALGFYTPHYYVDLTTVAEARGKVPERYIRAVGQEKMAVPPPGEDVVTMAANAARSIISAVDPGEIDMLIFATESGIDQSKAGGIYVHRLLGLAPRCRVFEVKQACYGATAAIQLALPRLAMQPQSKVLVIASDVARYGLGSAGEPTQGGGAVALLLTAAPRVLELEVESGVYTEDVMDFWRPNYRDEALVNGKASVRVYLRAVLETWNHYTEQTGLGLDDFYRFCYHLPFTRMAETAHKHLLKAVRPELNGSLIDEHISSSLAYNRVSGNSYSASLYIGLCSLLDNDEDDLTEKRIGLFSYGSGCMAEFFSGVIRRGYRDTLQAAHHRAMLDRREALSIEEYEAFYRYALPVDGSDVDMPEHDTGAYRLSAMRDHKRIYEAL